MRLYLPSFSKKFSLMIFNQKYFFQASFITMVMGFGMNLHASEVSQDEKNIEKVPLLDPAGIINYDQLEKLFKKEIFEEEFYAQ